MWSFEGEYRRRPQQKLGGRSKNIEKDALLSQLKNDREERENQRRKESATLSIQSWSRGVLSRRCTENNLREQVDLALALTKSEGLSQESGIRIIATLIRIFRPQKDSQRILLICQLIVRESKNLSMWVRSSPSRWSYLLPRLTNMALRVVTVAEKGDLAVSHAAPLRLLETLTSPQNWETPMTNDELQSYLYKFYTYLMETEYFSHLCDIVVWRVPEVYEPSNNPPTPLAESLLNLLIQPVIFATGLTDSKLLSSVIDGLCNDVLAKSMHTQIRNYIIPALTANKIMAVPVDVIISRLVCCGQLGQGPASTTSSTQQPAPALLYSLLQLVSTTGDFANTSALCNYLRVISDLLGQTTTYLVVENTERDSDDSDEEEMDSSQPVDPVLQKLAEDCVAIVNGTEHVSWLLTHVEARCSPEVLLQFSRLTHHLLTAPSLQLLNCRLLYSVVARRQLLRSMWMVLSGLQQDTSLSGENNSNPAAFGVSRPGGQPLLQILARGTPLTTQDRNTLVPLLATFCATLTAVLSTLHDSEMIGENDETGTLRRSSPHSQFPFTVDELIKMSASLRDVCVGLVDLAHPDVRMSAQTDATYKVMWAHCFKVCVGVVRQIHLRDTRRIFCPEGHWLTSHMSLPVGKNQPFMFKNNRRQRRLFVPQRLLTRDELETEGPPLSVTEQRRATILQELPFVFPFEVRTQVFSTLVVQDRSQSQLRSDFNEGPMINVAIRRTHIYEDAFEKLSYSNEPNLRLRMRVRLMNAVGLDEAGIDGGGIFREFLSELLKTAFDPTRGFFLLTRDNTLYPNPGSHHIAEDYQTHYYFIGRMVGKALYENLLVEVPLAGFFLSKLLGRSSSSVEFHHLDSLDPELCRNLLYLKTYSGDVQDLGLDFTILNSDLGQNTVDELIEDGSNITVTNENRIEYIYRMADYKLNKQIAKQCQAMRKGLFDIVPSEWLQMFDWRELQMLISGSFTPIDLADLMEHTRYGGSYNKEHPTIQAYWRVVQEFSELQMRQLLKFVTSCSRPPLLGFRELQPGFCIQPSGSEDRLPSASTCMNLLKLPEYKDDGTLREKLLYAITSGAGFELS